MKKPAHPHTKRSAKFISHCLQTMPYLTKMLACIALPTFLLLALVLQQVASKRWILEKQTE